jgi:large conductance mechanosensitive channel
MGIGYEEAKKQGAVLGYGNFITVTINFLVIAAVLFIVIRAMNRLMRQQDAKADVPKASKFQRTSSS